MKQNWLVFVTLLAVASSNGSAATSFWLSTTDSVMAAPSLGEVPLVTHRTGVSEGEIHIWARPAENETLANFSLNVRSDSPDVISFATGFVEIYNPILINSTSQRYQFVHDSEDCSPLITSPCIHTTAEKLSGFQAFTITEPAVGRGIGPATALIDPLYASARDAWLLATVKYNVLAPGVSNLYLQIGRHGILNQGSNPNSPADLDVVFGSDFSSPLSSNNNRECDVDCNSAGPQTTDAVISVTSLPPSQWGDYNDDGNVDAADYTNWRDKLGDNVSLGTSPDGVADGVIDKWDYQFWKDNYDNSFGIGMGSATVVPEPTSLGLMLVGFVTAALRRCR